MNTLNIIYGIAGLSIGIGLGMSKGWASKGRFLLVVITFAGAMAFVHCTVMASKFLGINYDINSPNQLIIIPLVAIQYCLFSAIIICLCAWIKEGFGDLLSLRDRGVLRYTIVGLVIALILGVLFKALIGISLGILLMAIVFFFVNIIEGMIGELS